MRNWPKKAFRKRRRSRTPGTSCRSPEITFEAGGEKAIRFDVGEKEWKCDLATYDCTAAGPAKKREEETAAEEPDPEFEPPYIAEQQGRGVQGRGAQGRGGQGRGQGGQPMQRDVPSPDGTWIAFVKDANVHVRPKDGGDAVKLSSTGTEGIPFGMISWSPDCKAVVAFRVEPGEAKEVHLLQSSPPSGGRAGTAIPPLPAPRRQVRRLRAVGV